MFFIKETTKLKTIIMKSVSYILNREILQAPNHFRPNCTAGKVWNLFNSFYLFHWLNGLAQTEPIERMKPIKPIKQIQHLPADQPLLA